MQLDRKNGGKKVATVGGSMSRDAECNIDRRGAARRSAERPSRNSIHGFQVGSGRCVRRLDGFNANDNGVQHNALEKNRLRCLSPYGWRWRAAGRRRESDAEQIAPPQIGDTGECDELVSRLVPADILEYPVGRAFHESGDVYIPEVLREIVRKLGGELALNCYVIRGGMIRVGAPVSQPS
jgi:hypothetical protein